MNTSRFLVVALAATLLFSGCAQQREPAQQALDKIEQSLEELKADAAKYAPQGLEGVQTQLRNLKKSFEEKHYADVITGSPQLAQAVSSLRDAVKAGKEQALAALEAARTEWQSLSADVSSSMSAIQSRIDELLKSKRLPRGMSKEEFEGSRAAFEAMQVEWQRAAEQAKNGATEEANKHARAAQGMADQIAGQLGITRT